MRFQLKVASSRTLKEVAGVPRAPDRHRPRGGAKWLVDMSHDDIDCLIHPTLTDGTPVDLSVLLLGLVI